MAYVNGSFVAYKPVKIVIELTFRNSVKSGGRLVKNRNRRILVKRTGKSELLLFATGKVNSVVMDYLKYLGINALWQLR